MTIGYLVREEMAVVVEPERQTYAEPTRTICQDCDRPILIAVVPTIVDRQLVDEVVVAEPYEWEPRAACFQCKSIRSRTHVCPACRGRGGDCTRCAGSGTVSDRRETCARCGGSGFVGTRRPPGVMLAIEVAWSDEGHVRLVSPRTSRKRGEAFYELHTCDHSC